MIRIELFGFGTGAVPGVLTALRALLSSKSYIQTNLIYFSIIPSEVIDFNGRDMAFIRVIGHMDRDSEIARLINDELNIEVEFQVLNQHYV